MNSKRSVFLALFIAVTSLIEVTAARTPCQLIQEEAFKRGHHIRVKSIGDAPIAEQNQPTKPKEIKHDPSERLYHLGGNSFLYIFPGKNSKGEEEVKHGLHRAVLLGCDTKGQCAHSRLSGNEGNRRNIEQVESDDGYLPHDYDDYQKNQKTETEYIAANFEKGDIKCQLVTFQRAQGKHHEDEKYSSQSLLLFCFPIHELGKFSTFAMKVADKRIERSLLEHGTKIEGVSLEILENQIDFNVSFSTGKEVLFRVPYPGDHLEFFHKTKEAFESFDLEKKRQYLTEKDPSLPENFLAKEFMKKYDFVKSKNGDVLMLEGAKGRQYCIDVPHRLAKMYPTLARNGKGPYTWRIAEHEFHEVFTLWSAKRHQRFEIEKIEFKLSGVLDRDINDEDENKFIKSASVQEKESPEFLRSLTWYFGGGNQKDF